MALPASVLAQRGIMTGVTTVVCGIVAGRAGIFAGAVGGAASGAHIAEAELIKALTREQLIENRNTIRNMKRAIEVVILFMKNEDMMLTIKQSVLGGLITGLSTAAGGYIAGPIGLWAGAVVGGIISAGTADYDMKPAWQVYLDMSPEDKSELIAHLRIALEALAFEQFLYLMGTLAFGANPRVVQIVASTITAFFKSKRYSTEKNVQLDI